VTQSSSTRTAEEFANVADEIPRYTRERWGEISEVLANPDHPCTLDPREFPALCEYLREQGILPAAASRWKGAPGYRMWPEALRGKVEEEVAASKAAHALLSSELGRILRIFGASQLRPVLLKGSDLAYRYYRPHFTRPMVDLDLFFQGERAATEAYTLLQTQGYRPQPTMGGSEMKPWGLRHQMPVLCHAKRGHLVEVHVGLFWAPADRRSLRTGGLTEVLDEVEVEGCAAFALQPEANVVYILAHMFEHHAAESPRFIALLDAATILAAEVTRFRWDRLLDLARDAGFERSTALGLASAKRFLGAQVPDPVFEALWDAGGLQLPVPKETAAVHHALDALKNAGSVREAVREILSQAFPDPAHMRSRYPKMSRWPLPLLYPVRWGGQALRLLSYVRERVRVHGRRGPRANDKERT